MEQKGDVTAGGERSVPVKDKLFLNCICAV